MQFDVPSRSLTVPVILLLVVSAVVIMAAVTVSGRRQDSLSVDNSIHVARSAITTLQDDLRNSVLRHGLRSAIPAGVGQPDWAVKIAASGAAGIEEATSGYLLDGANRVLHAVIDQEIVDDPSSVDLAATSEGGFDLLLERARTGSSAAPVVANGLLKLNDNVHFVAAVPIRSAPGTGTHSAEAPEPVFVLARRIDQPLLDRVGRDFLLGGLSIGGADSETAAASLALFGVDGYRLADLSWEPDLPGQAQIIELIPLLSVAWLVMIGLAWVFVRRSLKTVAEAERGANLEREKAILEESERTLRLSESRYRNLFEQSPIPILEQDWSGVKEMIDRLRDSGFRDLRGTIRNYLQEDSAALTPIKIIDINNTSLEVYRTTDKETCIKGLQKRFAESVPEGSAEVLAALAEGETRIATEGPEQALDGSDLIVRRWVQIPEEHRDTWSRVLVTVEDVTERKKAEERIRFLAVYDSLTGLPNRESFSERLRQTVAESHRSGRVFAVLFLDLDDFKSVNDTLGHGIGDQLLKAVAERLKAHMRESDAVARHGVETVSRFGGDEFTVILNDLTTVDAAATAAQRIIDTLSEPFDIDGRQIYSGSSIGIAIYPEDGKNPEQLLKNADLALYKSKQDRHRRYHFFVPEMDAEVLARKALEDDLRDAFGRGEMRLCYQPQIEVVNGRAAGFEALLRWTHPERGEVSPVKFVPTLENTNLIIPVGEWALRQACGQNKAWQEAGLPPLHVSVNISAVQIEHQDVLEMVEDALNETGLDPRYLHLEVTESVVMAHLETALAVLHGVRKLGVKVQLDDFGTGYSSLSYLRRFPIDTLKIDRAFVRDSTVNPDDAAIVRAIIDMAHTLGMAVTGEGVETEAQFDFLREAGCDVIQGFYVSQALEADKFEMLLREGGFSPGSAVRHSG
jgi:diguanylate cyclase (GGDEF)-like protein